MEDEITRLQRLQRDFATERDWGQFHSPRNLATALSVEASELLELFQWQGPHDSPVPDGKLEAIAEELADVFLYVLRFADVTGIDLVNAAHSKLAANAKKYPAEIVRGSRRKYDEY
jgi:dCTP diphosphatase